MKKYLFIFILFIVPILTSAQVDISRISLEYGFARNYQPDFGNEKFFALSPGIKLGGNFITNYFEWDFNISYWDDEITEPFKVRDAATYSYSSVNTGLRLIYFPPKIFLPVQFISGISARFINEEYLGGIGLAGNFRNGYNVHNVLLLKVKSYFCFRKKYHLK